MNENNKFTDGKSVADCVQKQTREEAKGLNCNNGNSSVEPMESLAKTQPMPMFFSSCHGSEKWEIKDKRPSSLRQTDSPKKEIILQMDFLEEIEIDFIKSVDSRILCRFLGVGHMASVKNFPYVDMPLMTFLLMEALPGFMNSKGYSFSGELDFSNEGDSIPVEKMVWKIKGKNFSFTKKGFLYFENLKKKGKKNNIAFFLFPNFNQGVASINCFSHDEKKSKNLMKELEEYTKKKNCLKGAKIKNINIFDATFSEVEKIEDASWENYYYEDNIKEIFDLEVFGFLKNIKKYNKLGITKRGVILFGEPGCVLPGTKIKIRKKKNKGKHNLLIK